MHTLAAGVVLSLLDLWGCPALPESQARAEAVLLAPLSARSAQFGSVTPGDEARHIADWAVQSRDHEGLPFMIVDKQAARLFVFDRSGRLLGEAPILVGAAIGDAFEPGVADMDMFQTRPWQRITPAGRFRADLDRTASGQWNVWVDYDTGIALHKVVPMSRAQRRHQRIASSDPLQRRITYGCINVPGAFFDKVIVPLMRRTDAMVYVLPETKRAQALFGSRVAPEPIELRRELAPVVYGQLKTWPPASRARSPAQGRSAPESEPHGTATFGTPSLRQVLHRTRRGLAPGRDRRASPLA